jgi:hypothetical protein
MRGTKLLLTCGSLLAAPAKAGAVVADLMQKEGSRRFVGIRHQYLMLDATDLIGMFAVGLTILCYTQEKYHPKLALVCAAGGVLAAVYGMMIDAWPLSVLEVMWAMASLRRWRQLSSPRRPRRRARPPIRLDMESRISRMFGSPN